MHNKKLTFLGAFLISSATLAQPIESGVVVGALPELSQNTLGTEQSFDPNLWARSDSQTLLSLIEKIGTIPLTPASQHAIVRLLMQDTTGSTFNDPQGILKQEAFLLARLNALSRLGEWESTLKLAQLVPDNQQTDDIQKIKINALLMKGDTEKACSLLEQKDLGAYTDKMRISCFLAREEKEKAILAYDIYQEAGTDNDPLFTALGETVLRELPTEFPKQFIINPEHVFLFALWKTPTADWTKQTTGIKKTLSDLPTTDIILRIRLGEQIHLSAEEMARIYKLPLMNIKTDTSFLKRASLFQQFRAALGEPERARILFEMMDSAQKDRLLLTLAPLFNEMLNEISLQSEYDDIAFNAVQVYGIQDNLSAAAAWYQVLSESKDARSQKQTLLLVPLMNQLGAGFPADLGSLTRVFCPGKTDPLCTHFWNVFPPHLYNEINYQQPTDIPSKQASYLLLENQEKTGENLLNALFELNQGQANHQQALSFIKQTEPLGLSRQLEREEMLFQ